MDPKITKIQATAVPDKHPPLDHLGEYQSTPGPEGRTIDRRQRGHSRPGEHRYFVAANEDYAEEDYERMEDIVGGHIGIYIVRAEAMFRVSGTSQRIETPGVGGIASDGDEYPHTVASEEMRTLADMLDSLGISHDVPVSGEWADDAPWSGTVSE